MQEKLDQQVANELASGGFGTIIIGGTKYVVRQPTPSDRAALGSEAVKTINRRREEKLHALFAKYGDTPAVLDRAMKAFGLDQPPPTDVKGIPEHDMARAVMDPACAAFLAWLLVRRDHPSVTLAELQKHITEENASEVAAVLLAESGMVKLDPNSDGATGSHKAPTT